MDNHEKLEKLYTLIDERDAYIRAVGKLNFDMECVAPPDGLEQAGRDMAVLGRKIHETEHSARWEELVCALHEDGEGLTMPQRKLIGHLYDDYRRQKHVSADLSYRMDLASNTAYGTWLEAKKKNDFSIFRDSLAETVSLTREIIATREDALPLPYDNLLDDTEKGGSIRQLDAFFGELRGRIVPLMHCIAGSGRTIRTDFMNRTMPAAKQAELSEWILDVEGLKKSALVLMTTEHPFTESFGPQDVRVTTHYYEDNFISGVFSTMHEGGHALFMQGEPEEYYKCRAAGHMTNAMHECVSRFYENIVGRNEAFIRFLAPKLRALSDGALDDVTDRELYEAVNESHPSLIRTEADELTYCLHIMVRYEIEKALINGEMTVDEVPAAWNEKYREYLGIEVPSDTEGCLQDVHWTLGVGGFGYFPSYALGNAYGAQILSAMKQDIDFDKILSQGRLYEVRDWMRAHVFASASVMDPDEWIRHITGESLNTDYYCSYLEEKYADIYRL